MTEAGQNQEELVHALKARVEGLLKTLPLELELETEISDQRLLLNVVGKDAEHLLNHRGEVLKGLTLLLKVYQEKHFPDTEIEIKMDANRFLIEKESELRNMAQEASRSLKEPGEEVTLEPLNSYDRRIVHLELQDQPHLQTKSVGMGHMKSIVIRHMGEGQPES